MNLETLADALEQGVAEEDTLRFSECVVRGRKGYQWGAVTSTSVRIVWTLCACYNNRQFIAAAIREKLAREPQGD